MPFNTVVCGLMLVVIGGFGYANATPDAETGKVSPTALIPAFVGGLLVLLGLLAHKDNVRKHVMHLAAVVGVLGFVGGFMPLIRQQSKGVPFDPSAPAARNGLLMSLVCLVFVGMCVKSFIDARKARQFKAQG
jgi:hypothetical protein